MIGNADLSVLRYLPFAMTHGGAASAECRERRINWWTADYEVRYGDRIMEWRHLILAWLWAVARFIFREVAKLLVKVCFDRLKPWFSSAVSRIVSAMRSRGTSI